MILLLCLGAVLTYVILVTLHVICKGSAGKFIGPKEAEVTGDLSGYGGGQTLEEALWPLVLHDGLHHGPHCAIERAGGFMSSGHYTVDVGFFLL